MNIDVNKIIYSLVIFLLVFLFNRMVKNLDNSFLKIDSILDKLINSFNDLENRVIKLEVLTNQKENKKKDDYG